MTTPRSGTYDTQTMRAHWLMQSPTPLIDRVNGNKLLIYRDKKDMEYGKYLVLPDTQERRSKTSGTVIAVGDGYMTDAPYQPDEWRAHCPFKPGDRILFGSYDGVDIGLRVDPEWWNRKENERTLAHMMEVHREELVPFVWLEPNRVITILAYPQAEIWEE